MTIGRQTYLVPSLPRAGDAEPHRDRRHHPLPEAQVDHFMMLKVLVGYPSTTEEFVIVERMTSVSSGGGQTRY